MCICMCVCVCVYICVCVHIYIYIYIYTCIIGNNFIQVTFCITIYYLKLIFVLLSFSIPFLSFSFSWMPYSLEACIQVGMLHALLLYPCSTRLQCGKGSACPHRMRLVPACFQRGMPGKGLVRVSYIPRRGQVLRRLARILAVDLAHAVSIEHALSILPPSRTVACCGPPSRPHQVRPGIFLAPRGCYVVFTRSMAYGPKMTYRSMRGLHT